MTCYSLPKVLLTRNFVSKLRGLMMVTLYGGALKNPFVHKSGLCLNLEMYFGLYRVIQANNYGIIEAVIILYCYLGFSLFGFSKLHVFT